MTISAAPDKVAQGAIDVHCHLYPETYLDFVRRRGEMLGAPVYQDDTGQERLAVSGMPDYAMTPDYRSPAALVAWMDEAGLAQVVLAPAPPCTFSWADPAVTAELTPLINQGIGEAVRRYPDRIIGGATVSLNAPDGAPDELSQAVEEHGLRSALILTSINGENLDEPKFFPFFERAATLGVPIFIHPNPFSPVGYERLTRYYMHNLVGMTTDTTVAIISLIYSGLFEKLPALRVWFAHAGGSFPVLRARVEHAYHVRPETQGLIPKPPSAYFEHLAFETLAHDPSVLRYAIESFGAARMMVGSDYPYAIGTRRPVDLVRRLDLPPAQRRAILAGNARAFFGQARDLINATTSQRTRMESRQREQLAPDALAAPPRAFPRHRGDQLADIGAEPRAPEPRAGLPTPEEPPALPVPADDRLWPHDGQVSTPLPPEQPRQHPEEPVAPTQPRPPPCGASQDGELLAQQEVLGR